MEHLGSAHTDAELALLLAAAWERLSPGAAPTLAPTPESVAWQQAKRDESGWLDSVDLKT